MYIYNIYNVYIYTNVTPYISKIFPPVFFNGTPSCLLLLQTLHRTEAPSLVEFWGQRVAEFARRQSDSLLIAVQVEMVGDLLFFVLVGGFFLGEMRIFCCFCWFLLVGFFWGFFFDFFGACAK